MTIRARRRRTAFPLRCFPWQLRAGHLDISSIVIIYFVRGLIVCPRIGIDTLCGRHWSFRLRVLPVRERRPAHRATLETRKKRFENDTPTRKQRVV